MCALGYTWAPLGNLLWVRAKAWDKREGLFHQSLGLFIVKVLK